MLRICTLILLWTMMVVGCSGRFLSPPPVPPKIETQRLVVVTAGQQDTLALSLPVSVSPAIPGRAFGNIRADF
jgi:hypothetical protein